MLNLSLGIACLAALLGFLVGASESPVAGIAITATFGIVATVLSTKLSSSALDPNSQKSRDFTAVHLTQLGRILIIFSVLFASGLAVGIAARLKFNETDAPSLPWEGKQAPRSAKQAVDWIIVNNKLRGMGYSQKQVMEIYELEVARRKGEKDENSSLSDELISPLLESKKEEGVRKKTPFMAWDPDTKKKLLGPRIDG